MPGGYSQDVRSKVLERIADGESLRSIARTEGMPSPSTVVDWCDDPEFAVQYARAREVQADVFFELIGEIANDGAKDWVESKFGPISDQEHISRSRLRVDTLKWQASKLVPKKYGDKLALGGASDLPPIQAAITVEFVKPPEK